MTSASPSLVEGLANELEIDFHSYGESYTNVDVNGIDDEMSIFNDFEVISLIFEC